jgi:2-methylisocitrate lyase-like PEP mutase family enzyme
VEQFKAMGYNCVIYPVTTLRVAMQAIDKLLDDILLNHS